MGQICAHEMMAHFLKAEVRDEQDKAAIFANNKYRDV